MVSAFSIGTSKRSTEWKNQSAYVPGPGTYNPVKKYKIKPPSWKIGSSLRNGRLKKGVPGPGNYEIPVKITKEGPKFIFGLKINDRARENFPGPGSYNDSYRNVKKSLPKYSFGLKSTSFLRHGFPGPGTYEPNKESSVVNQPSMKFGKEERSSLSQRSFSPGVGSYNLRSSDVNGPKFGFGRSVRDLNEKFFAPGPGTYELSRSFIDSLKGKTMISRRKDFSGRQSRQNPGPSDYMPEKPRSKASIRFGNSSRESSFSHHNPPPGPGSYDPSFIDKPDSSRIKIGTSTRRPLSANNKYPGPGNYNIPSRSIEGPKFFMGLKNVNLEGKKKGLSPGPGAYVANSSYVLERGSSPIIGTSPRSSVQKNKNSPGPGQYDIRGGAMGPKWGFGTGLRPKTANSKDPGPGTYLIPPTFADVPKYLISTPNKYVV